MRYDNVIVGAGLAGGSLARAYRAAGGDGSLLLVGDEPHPPYNRPPLTKEYLRGEQEAAAAHLEPAGWWREREIELRTGTEVTALDPGAHELELAGGERVGYGRLALATGAAPRPLHGAALLRTLEDADRLRGLVRAGSGRLAVIGGGFIGIEAAASAAMKGLDVTLVMRNRVVWDHLFGAESAATSSASSRRTASPSSPPATSSPWTVRCFARRRARPSPPTTPWRASASRRASTSPAGRGSRPRAASSSTSGSRPAQTCGRWATSPSGKASCTAGACASSTGTWP